MSLPWMTSVIDWDTCKVEYEVLGDSLERIAAVHEVSLSSLKRVAEEENWVPAKESTAPLEEYLKGMINAHRAKLTLAALYREMQVFPRVIAAEDSLLTKINSAIEKVDLDSPYAPQALRALGQSLSAITERRLISTAIDEDDAPPMDTTWTTVIVDPAEQENDHLRVLPRRAAGAGN